MGFDSGVGEREGDFFPDLADHGIAALKDPQIDEAVVLFDFTEETSDTGLD